MAANLGDAYVNIIPKAPGISGNIEGLLGGSEASAGAQKAGSGLGAKLASGLKLGAAAAGAGLIAVIKSSFEAGGALEQSFGGLDTIYGEASAQAKEFAMQAASAGISANTYAEQAVSMGAALKAAFGGDTAAAAEAANTAIMDMADNAAKMGTPIESLQAAYQGFAKGQYQLLDNLKLGYGGSRTEMERLLADAQKLTGVEYNIDNLGDVYAAIHAIQEDLGLTGVAAAEANTTLQGSFGSMKASWENLMAAMSTGEGVDQAMENMSSSVGAFLSNVGRMGGTTAKELPGVLKGLAGKVLENAPDFIASGLELMLKLAIGVVEGTPKLTEKAPEMGKRFKEAFSKVDWSALGIQLIGGIVTGVNRARERVWEAIKSALSGLGSRIWAWIKEQIRGGGGGDESGSSGSAAANASKAVGSGGWSAGYAAAMEPAGYRAKAAAAGAALSAQDLARALSGIEIVTNVVLQGDAGEVFKVVRRENSVRIKATGRSPLAARG